MLLSALLGLSRGAVREALGIANWLLALVLAASFAYVAEPWISDWITIRTWRLVAAAGVVFAAAVLVGGLLIRMLGAVVNASGLGGTDRLLGAIFGFGRGLIMVIVLMGITKPLLSESVWWQSSWIVSELTKYEEPVMGILGEMGTWYQSTLQEERAKKDSSDKR